MACWVGPTVVFAIVRDCRLLRYFISSTALFFLGIVYLAYTFLISAKMIRRREVPAPLEGIIGLESVQLVLRGHGRLSTTSNFVALTQLVSWTAPMGVSFPFAMMSHGSHSHGATFADWVFLIHLRNGWLSATVFWGCSSLVHCWWWIWAALEEGLLLPGEPLLLDIRDGLSSLRRPCGQLLLILCCLVTLGSPFNGGMVYQLLSAQFPPRSPAHTYRVCCGMGGLMLSRCNFHGSYRTLYITTFPHWGISTNIARGCYGFVCH